MKPFAVPKDGQIYVSEITDRCRDLISYGIWNDLHVSQLQRWLANFITPQERYFAACILDKLIYRSKFQTIALIKKLFERTLPDLIRLDPTPIGGLDDPLERLQSHATEPGIRLVSAVKSTDPPTKSGYIIARYMKQHFSINEAWVITPWNVPALVAKGIRVFIFIDDFLGTGDQFAELLNLENLGRHQLARVYVVYSPLVAHERGQHFLSAQFPELRVKSVEVLDETYGVFHPQCPCFTDGTNTPQSAKEFYYQFLKNRQIDITGPDRRGYGHLELVYSFEHATPDNSLPILWWRNTPTWKPLFDR